jgi:putative membrane protein
MMEAVLQSFLAGAPVLILHFALTLAMLGLGATLYVMITPYHELQLIRDGNVAAAISLGGVLLGMAIPLAFAMAASVNTIDILIFGALTLVLQLACYRIADFLIRDLPRRIVDGEISAAILLASIKLSVGAINAAAVGG